MIWIWDKKNSICEQFIVIFHFLGACSVPLGLSTGEIKDWQITASSIDEQRKEQCQANFIRLYVNDNDRAWCPRINQPHQWIQIDLGTPTKVIIEYNEISLFYLIYS